MKKNIASQLGFWASVFGAVFGGIYLLLLIFYFSTEGFVFPPSPFVQLVGGIITFLAVPGRVILFTAIRFVNEEDNKILGSLGVRWNSRTTRGSRDVRNQSSVDIVLSYHPLCIREVKQCKKW